MLQLDGFGASGLAFLSSLIALLGAGIATGDFLELLAASGTFLVRFLGNLADGLLRLEQVFGAELSAARLIEDLLGDLGDRLHHLLALGRGRFERL